MAGDGRLAARVAAGILVSRVLGFLRERAIAHYLGNGVAVDAYRAALRIPNLLRNLLGEGTLSASFIPVYASLAARDARASRALAGAIAGLLLVATAALALAGIGLAPIITRVVAPGFGPAAHDLATTLVRILFPMTGLLALSAWCLGVLTTHGRFFLPYVAPAVWTIAGIAALVGGAVWLATPAELSVALAWGLVAGSALQLGIQLPACLRLLGGLPLSLARRIEGVADVVRAWVPVVLGAGAIQVSGLIETQIASLAGPGAVASLGYAQLLQVLPVSLFGVSVAAVALPELSRDAGGGAETTALRARLAAGLSRIAFFLVPTAVLYAGFGPTLAAALFETGRFTRDDSTLVGGILAAYGIGIWAQASVKLLASGFYAQRETRAPARVAVLALAVSTGLAWLLLQVVGVAGIALGAALGGYLNATLLLRGLDRRLGRVLGGPTAWHIARSAAAAGAAGLAGWLLLAMTPPAGPVISCALLVVIFGITYVGVALALGHPEARRLLRRHMPLP